MKNRFIKKSLGFTLTELMIVTAIISILAAIALPAYSTHTARAQTMEGFQATDGLRQDIAAWVYSRKTLPDAAAVATTGTIGAQAVNLKGKYIQDGGITIAANTGVITIPFDAGNHAGQHLTLTPTLNLNNGEQIIQWQCGGSIAANHLPSACQ